MDLIQDLISIVKDFPSSTYAAGWAGPIPGIVNRFFWHFLRESEKTRFKSKIIESDPLYDSPAKVVKLVQRMLKTRFFLSRQAKQVGAPTVPLAVL
jgi:hypothetical protein